MKMTQMLKCFALSSSPTYMFEISSDFNTFTQ